MERENLFIVLSVILMLVIAIYEAMSTGRGALVFGKHFMNDPVEEFTDDTINGTSLPPIIDYKKALYHSLYRAINTAIDAAVKQEPKKINGARALLRDFQGYYSKAYIRYIFTLNTSGKLTHNLLPKTFPVDLDDLKYYMSTYGLGDYIGYIQRASLPKYGDSQFSGPLVNATYSDGAYSNNGSPQMINTLTGDQIEITRIQYNRLKELYTGPPDLFNNMAYTVLYVYFNLGSLGNNGSVPIGLIDDTYIELFGSPLNTQQRYCSPFQFEVDYFSSLGNFFSYRLSPGQKYTCNPPYSDSLLTATAKRLISELQRNGPQASIDIFMLIPVWDREGKILCGSNEKSSNEPIRSSNNNNERFMCLELLRSSGYIRAERILRKDDHKYYSWFGDKYISYCHTYAIVLSTSIVSKIDLDSMLKKWDSIVYGPTETNTSTEFGTNIGHNIEQDIEQNNNEPYIGSGNLVLEDESADLE